MADLIDEYKAAESPEYASWGYSGAGGAPIGAGGGGLGADRMAGAGTVVGDPRAPSSLLRGRDGREYADDV